MQMPPSSDRRVDARRFASSSTARLSFLSRPSVTTLRTPAPHTSRLGPGRAHNGNGESQSGSIFMSPVTCTPFCPLCFLYSGEGESSSNNYIVVATKRALDRSCVCVRAAIRVSSCALVPPAAQPCRHLSPTPPVRLSMRTGCSFSPRCGCPSMRLEPYWYSRTACTNTRGDTRTVRGVHTRAVSFVSLTRVHPHPYPYSNLISSFISGRGARGATRGGDVCVGSSRPRKKRV